MRSGGRSDPTSRHQRRCMLPSSAITRAAQAPAARPQTQALPAGRRAPGRHSTPGHTTKGSRRTTKQNPLTTSTPPECARAPRQPNGPPRAPRPGKAPRPRRSTRSLAAADVQRDTPWRLPESAGTRSPQRPERGPRARRQRSGPRERSGLSLPAQAEANPGETSRLGSERLRARHKRRPAPRGGRGTWRPGLARPGPEGQTPSQPAPRRPPEGHMREPAGQCRPLLGADGTTRSTRRGCRRPPKRAPHTLASAYPRHASPSCREPAHSQQTRRRNARRRRPGARTRPTREEETPPPEPRDDPRRTPQATPIPPRQRPAPRTRVAERENGRGGADQSVTWRACRANPPRAPLRIPTTRCPRPQSRPRLPGASL